MPDTSRLGGWADLDFFASPGWAQLGRKLAEDERRILPAGDRIFAALELTQPRDVRVVILGQDPYPTPGHANGLAFSVAPGIALPRSLSNIFRELEADLGGRPESGDLTGWARQGVLLLNTALSVPAGAAGGHAGLGWQPLVEEVIARASRRPTAWLLWGRHAQCYRTCIRPGAHLIVETAHPSPLSARRGFFGSRPFSRVNAWLEAQQEPAIDWIGR